MLLRATENNEQLALLEQYGLVKSYKGKEDQIIIDLKGYVFEDSSPNSEQH